MEAAEFARLVDPWVQPTAGGIGAQLTLAIRQAIGAGMLQAGERLPPERALATALHVSRPTVSAVMDGLRQAGLVESRQGSGTWVAEATPTTSEPVPFAELLHRPSTIDLAAATASDASMLPPIRIETADLLAVDPPNGLVPVGLATLREVIAARARRYVPSTTADDVVVTSGAHQALSLLMAALVPRGAVVLVEDVTYGGMLDLARSHGCRPIPVPRDAGGVDPIALAQALKRHRPAMTILVASVHSPTGTVASEQRCRELATILHDAPGEVVIDETYADLEFVSSGRRLSTELGQRAIRVGSMSKATWLGLRIGWVIGAGDLATRLIRRRWAQFDLGVAIPAQLYAQQVFGSLDDIVAKRVDSLRARAELVATLVAETFPRWSATPVGGGPAMWIQTETEDARPIVDRAAEAGVALLPGQACRVDQQPDPHLRLCFDRPEPVLEAAFERLATLEPGG